jgi:hypothetical protein
MAASAKSRRAALEDLPRFGGSVAREEGVASPELDFIAVGAHRARSIDDAHRSATDLGADLVTPERSDHLGDGTSFSEG